MNFRYFILWMSVFVPSVVFGWNFSGRVTDDNGLPLPGISVSVDTSLTGTVTDPDGRFNLSLDGDTVLVTFSSIGYETKFLKATKWSPYIRMTLKEETYNLEGVQVEARVKQYTTNDHIDVEGMRHLPSATTGSISSLIQSSSGVVSSNELSQQYSVRGGSYDENSIYVNDIEIFRPQLVRNAQQEGLSFVNLDMVESVNFSSGGFGADYGDKMSSVLDIKYRKPTRKIEGRLSGSFLGASAYIGSRTGKFSQMHGFRYKNSSYLFKKLETSGDYRTNFIDYQTYLTFDITPRAEISFLGNISNNKYEFAPKDRKTSFGTMTNMKEFTVYFDGGEKDLYRSFFGNLSYTLRPNKRLELKLLANGYRSNEDVNYDISGEYWLSDIDMSGDNKNVYASEDQGIGRYHEHARSSLDVSIASLSHIGERKFEKNVLKWGATIQKEKIFDHASEWESRDSAGYSMPMNPDALSLYSNLYSDHKINASRFILFAQNTFKAETNLARLVLTAGVRYNYWSFNKEHLVSPRVQLAVFPTKAPQWGFRFALGRYCQSPFYKEIRDTTIMKNGNVEVSLNHNIKSPRSNQIVFSADRYFSLWKRPFKFTVEAYGKYIDRIIPYNIDNVKIVYEGENRGDGYVVGADAKLFGEFVPGVDSWISLSFMRARENIYGDGVGYINSPNARLCNISFFFQDHFPRLEQLKMNLKFNFADGFKFGPPNSERKYAIYDSPAYIRVDIGLTYSLQKGKDKIMERGFLKYLRGLSLSLDCLNLIDRYNVSSYYWITDVNGQQNAVPNYLTGRQVNLKLDIDF